MKNEHRNLTNIKPYGKGSSPKSVGESNREQRVGFSEVWLRRSMVFELGCPDGGFRQDSRASSTWLSLVGLRLRRAQLRFTK